MQIGKTLKFVECFWHADYGQCKYIYVRGSELNVREDLKYTAGKLILAGKETLENTHLFKLMENPKR